MMMVATRNVRAPCGGAAQAPSAGQLFPSSLACANPIPPIGSAQDVSLNFDWLHDRFSVTCLPYPSPQHPPLLAAALPERLCKRRRLTSKVRTSRDSRQPTPDPERLTRGSDSSATSMYKTKSQVPLSVHETSAYLLSSPPHRPDGASVACGVRTHPHNARCCPPVPSRPVRTAPTGSVPPPYSPFDFRAHR